MSLEQFLKTNKVQIINMILDYLRTQYQNNQNYEVVWKEYQTQVCDFFIKYLKENGFNNIKITTKKSTYPEFKVFEGNNVYAFDVKVSVDTQDPAYDIARLDTFKERMEKYKNEYEVVVKYNITLGVVSVFFEELHNIVGIQKKQDGVVKYRPYDGKVRPKTWSDFESKKNYFNSKEDLLSGVRRAQVLRNKSLYEAWKKEFSQDEINIILN